MKIATDLSVVVACETLIDAVNLTDTDGPMNSPIDYPLEYDEECQDARCELRSDRVQSASIRKTSYVKNPTVQLRTFFPENWLFDILESEDGIIERSDLHYSRERCHVRKPQIWMILLHNILCSDFLVP